MSQRNWFGLTSRQSARSQKVVKITQRKLFLEGLETRTLMAGDIRAIDGSGNNVVHPEWGTPGEEYIRKNDLVAYDDGVSSPAGASRPSAREISNAVADEGAERDLSERGLSAMIYAWGQFLDHDLDLTLSATPSELFSIPVPTGDAYFDPAATGTQTIPLTRSQYDPATGTSTANPRQQVNSITAWIDGSMIYGSDEATADSLREHVGGRMLQSTGNLLPRDASGMFLAGDIRANENPELLSLQTLFVREHNRVATRLAQQHPAWTDEQLYQAARNIVIGEVQVITYKEWLPALLGNNAIRPYQGYKPNVNPTIANEFATAAFRLGHSMLGDDIEFLDNNGNEIAEEVSLAEAFFNPDLVVDHGIDSILKYLASDPSSEIDNQIVDSVRNFLFGPPGAGGLDLASLNIQRGRDHGLADYNSLRAAYGLPKVNSFAQITADAELQTKLRDLYGNVNNIDAWVGMLAEDHVAGASVGALVQRILVDQFTRLRDGDRFWYQRSLSSNDLREVQNTTLTDVIRRNTELTNLQQNSFFFRVEISGRVFQDGNRDGVLGRNEAGLRNRTIELVDAQTQEVIATTQTDTQGRYQFDVQDGLGVGQFTVREVTPAGWVETARPTQTLVITRGEMRFAELNFGQAPVVVPPPAPTQTPTSPTSPPRPTPPPQLPRNAPRTATPNDTLANATTTTGVSPTGRSSANRDTTLIDGIGQRLRR